jgi:hypothetical protein
MKLPRRNFLHLAAGAAALPAVSRIARAQAYPTRRARAHSGRAYEDVARSTRDHRERVRGRRSIGVGRVARAERRSPRLRLVWVGRPYSTHSSGAIPSC